VSGLTAGALRSASRGRR